jgi:Na+/H+ antiporter NhaD/arsenite permease-like protein
LFVAIFDRKVLIIDYSLLIVFIFFFGLADNIRFVLNAAINSSEHVFLFSALISQLISNVPAALLFSKYTIQWKALLWGVSVGGFGSLFGSLANLIAYKIFINHKSTSNSGVFTVKFLLIGYLAFFISVALYFVL